MAFSVFIVVLFALMGCSNGNVNDIPCVENGARDGPTEICINKPPTYTTDLENKMDHFVKQAKDWEGFKHETIDDYNEVEEDFGNDDNCGTRTTIEKPYVLKINSSTESSSFYVVQSESQNFEQKIRVTRCMNVNGSCMKSISENFTSSCKTKLASISFYVYDPINDTMIYKPFEIPVCCTCHLSENFNL